MEWKTKRQILFQKDSSGKPKEKKQKPTKKAETTQNSTNPENKGNSSVLYKWLGNHLLINLNGLCKKVGYDRANLIKNMESGKELKPELKVKFIEILKEYGYAE